MADINGLMVLENGLSFVPGLTKLGILCVYSAFAFLLCPEIRHYRLILILILMPSMVA
jgi:hypothetical protein